MKAILDLGGFPENCYKLREPLDNFREVILRKEVVCPIRKEVSQIFDQTFQDYAFQLRQK